MAGADEIIADYGSLIGSIGVIFGPFQQYRDVKATTGTLFTEGYVTTGGIEYSYLTEGKDKDFGNPFREMRKEERAVLQAGLANVYDDFVTWVATNRELDRAVITEQLGAHIFDPEAAIANGLIDSQMGIDEAYRQAAKVMGVDPADTRVVTPAAPSMLEQLLGVSARVPGHAIPLKAGEAASAAICGSTPRALVFHGRPGAVCG
jgi:protease-4